MRACVRACLRACVHACVCACVRECVWACDDRRLQQAGAIAVVASDGAPVRFALAAWRDLSAGAQCAQGKYIQHQDAGLQLQQVVAPFLVGDSCAGVRTAFAAFREVLLCAPGERQNKQWLLRADRRLQQTGGGIWPLQFAFTFLQRWHRRLGPLQQQQRQRRSAADSACVMDPLTTTDGVRVERSTITCSSALSACAKGGNWLLVGVEWYNITYNAAISACGNYCQAQQQWLQQWQLMQWLWQQPWMQWQQLQWQQQWQQRRRLVQQQWHHRTRCNHQSLQAVHGIRSSISRPPAVAAVAAALAAASADAAQLPKHCSDQRLRPWVAVLMGSLVAKRWPWQAARHRHGRRLR